uniref:NAD(P)-binding domain-containing protein n=1 Tax=Aureoumbra lagunensis TaxID=44058 RepID=A0A7S3JP41_9STRA|mmetsp:Transcript_23407/g.30389  ORF Transcript_23407/g.30389 Transcript_23407/m.30389 type:complete len:355 (-) Transcript_23407:140-1204(-)
MHFTFFFFLQDVCNALVLTPHALPSKIRTRSHQTPTTMVFGQALRVIRGGQTTTQASGMKVAVIGSSGNVGRVVTKELLDGGYDVTAVVRSVESGDKIYEYLTKNVYCENFPNIRIADISNPDDESNLRSALRGVEKIIICTGTTAFPTKAWAGGDVSTTDVSKVVLNALIERSFDRELTMKYLSAIGLNTPQVVDADGVERVTHCVDEKSLSHIVLMSSVGVSRRMEFPFTILNTCGVLDAKAKGEAAVMNTARKINADWTIVRPGQLFGEPYTNNKYIGTLFKLDKDDQTQGLEFKKGDSGAGDTLRGSLAHVLVQTLKNEATRNIDFTVLTIKGRAPDVATLNAQLTTALA